MDYGEDIKENFTKKIDQRGKISEDMYDVQNSIYTVKIILVIKYIWLIFQTVIIIIIILIINTIFKGKHVAMGLIKYFKIHLVVPENVCLCYSNIF